MRLALLALGAVLLWFVAPYWLQEGMFMDGQIYAAVAQNLADGLGTFWAPVYQPSSTVPYSEQLPMFTGLESLFFQPARAAFGVLAKISHRPECAAVQ